MAVFTALQADAAIAIRIDSHKIAGAHDHYVFAVTHNGVRYEWEDSELVAGATKLQIKTALKNKLIATEKKVVAATQANVTADLASNIIGNTIGSL